MNNPTARERDHKQSEEQLDLLEDFAARATAMAIGSVAFFMKPFAVRDALSQSRRMSGIT
jgi:hypothetical protein